MQKVLQNTVMCQNFGHLVLACLLLIWYLPSDNNLCVRLATDYPIDVLLALVDIHQEIFGGTVASHDNMICHIQYILFSCLNMYGSYGKPLTNIHFITACSLSGYCNRCHGTNPESSRLQLVQAQDLHAPVLDSSSGVPCLQPPKAG